MESSFDVPAACVQAEELLAAGNAAGALVLLQPLLAANPQNPIAHAIFAAASAARGDGDSAEAHFKRALSLEPDLIAVHLQYASLLTKRGNLPEAVRHIEASYKPHQTWFSPYNGNGQPLRVLQLGSAVVDGLTETDQFLSDGSFETTTVIVQYWHRARTLPPHDLVFNSIADPDRCAATLDVAEWLLTQTRAPVLNSPHAVRDTGRVRVAERLSKIPGVVTPRIRRVSRSALARAEIDRASLGFDLPVLLRAPGDHNGRNFFFAETLDDVTRCARQLPGDDVLLIQYIDTRREGLYRKYRAMIAGGDVLPAHLAVSPHWNVHYFSAQMGERERMDEAAFLEDMPAAVGSRAMGALRNIARRLNLDYAGVDFGLTDDGDVVVFEANAAMTVHVPEASEATNYRREAAFRIFAAARGMISAKRE